MGGMVTTRGARAKKRYKHTASAALYGLTRQRSLDVAALSREADLDKFAAGYFAAYADPAIAVVNLIRAGDMTAPALPWNGQGLLTDPTQGALGRDVIASISVDFDWVYRETVNLGITSNYADPISSASSYFAPSSFGDLISDVLPEATAWIDDAPYVTDETPPYEDLPTLAGPDVPYIGEPGTLPGDSAEGGFGEGAAPLTGAGAEAVLGAVISFNLPGGVKFATAYEKLRPCCRVSNGGNNAALRTEATPLPIYFFFSERVLVAGVWTQVSTGNYAGTYDAASSGGGYESFVTASGSGFQPVGESVIFCSVKIITDANPGGTHYPADPTGSDFLKCPSVRCLDTSGISNVSNIAIQAGWPVTGT